jgi:hypothetical protein
MHIDRSEFALASSLELQIVTALWAQHDRRPISQETGLQDLICVEDGKGGTEAPPELITRRPTSGALRPCGRLWHR